MKKIINWHLGILAPNLAAACLLLIPGVNLAVPTIAAARDAEVSARQTKAASEGSTVPYRNPQLHPEKTLSGVALLAELRQGGYVMFMRHTETGTVTDACEQSNLSSRGERDARFVGESVRKLGIPIGRVLSSPVCRVADTAKLIGLGEPELTNDLSNVPMPPDADLGAARAKRLAETPVRATRATHATNTLLVSHMQSGKTQAQWIYLDFGEIVIFRPDGKGESNAVARIRADDWYDLMALENK